MITKDSLSPVVAGAKVIDVTFVNANRYTASDTYSDIAVLQLLSQNAS